MFGDLSAYIQGLYPVKHIGLGHFIRARLSFVITYWTVLASVESCCVNAFSLPDTFIERVLFD